MYMFALQLQMYMYNSQCNVAIKSVYNEKNNGFGALNSALLPW